MIAKGMFREDLFYRLNVVPIHLPALRERTSDIPLLVGHFLEKFNERLKKKLEGATPEALAKLVAYPWPGNIRELENVIERAVLFADESRIGAKDLTPEVRGEGRVSLTPLPGSVAPYPGTQSSPSSPEPGVPGDAGLREQVRAAMARLEKDLIVRALQQTGGNVTRAARLLKISRKGLQLKMKELGLRETPV
jgi:DNA-binding NtrC family response regulator